ncbi:MAG: stage III sporulation protein AD [Oscillibacter sp.]|nr:stage III sporulation protein AD [Oscillibacter sp.]
MELLTRVAALCVTSAVLAVVLRQGAQTAGLLLTLSVTVTVLLFLLRASGELFAFLRELGEQSGLSPALLTPLYKTVGIALVVRTGGALCRDAGESALASTVETAGTVCALLTALPLLREMMNMLLKLMS